MQDKKIINSLMIIIFLIMIYGSGHYLTYLKYNDREYIENNVLKIENQNLSKELNTLKNELNININDLNYIISRVTNRNMYNFYNELIIDANNEMIVKGSPVINSEGLIGIVEETTNESSIVKLLTGDYNISVKVNDTYGNLSNKKVTLLDKYKEINIGDKIYTSGLTKIPENIYVGEVTKVYINDEDTTKVAEIKLIDNMNLNYVGVIKIS